MNFQPTSTIINNHELSSTINYYQQSKRCWKFNSNIANQSMVELVKWNVIRPWNVIFDLPPDLLIRQPPSLPWTVVDRLKFPSRSTNRWWWMIFQGLLMGVRSRTSFCGYTPKNSKKPHINKAPNRSHLLGSLFGIDVTITISATSDKIQGEWNEDRYQKRHLDVFWEEA